MDMTRGAGLERIDLDLGTLYAPDKSRGGVEVSTEENSHECDRETYRFCVISAKA